MGTIQIKQNTAISTSRAPANQRFESISHRAAIATSLCILALSLAAPGPLKAAQREPAVQKSHQQAEKITLGWLQSIRLLPHKLRMTAKLDTGAKKSVIHALSIEPFQQSGKEWVRFIVPAKKRKEDVELKFELPVIDKSRVKQHHTQKLDVRYVVALDFCINGSIYTAHFSLDNREKFNYPVLLGRDFLKQHFVVDPSSTFIKKYNCH